MTAPNAKPRLNREETMMSENPYLLHGNELERTEAARRTGQSQPAPKPRAGEHTPGPWHAEIGSTFIAVHSKILGRIGKTIYFDYSPEEGRAEKEANAQRIVACVNACEGFATDELEREPGRVRSFLRGSDRDHERDALREQNAELVEALRGLLADCDADTKPMGLHPARALLAKVRT